MRPSQAVSHAPRLMPLPPGRLPASCCCWASRSLASPPASSRRTPSSGPFCRPDRSRATATPPPAVGPLTDPALAPSASLAHHVTRPPSRPGWIRRRASPGRSRGWCRLPRRSAPAFVFVEQLAGLAHAIPVLFHLARVAAELLPPLVLRHEFNHVPHSLRPRTFFVPLDDLAELEEHCQKEVRRDCPKASRPPAGSGTRCNSKPPFPAVPLVTSWQMNVSATLASVSMPVQDPF